MNYFMKMIKSHEESGLLINGISKAIQNKWAKKNQKADFWVYY